MRRFAVTFVLLGGLGFACSGAPAAAAPAAAGCNGYTGITQAMNGRISGCLQVGSLPAGHYTVSVNQVLDLSRESAAERRKLSRAGGAVKAPHEPAVALRISPAAGRPGTRVTVTGRLAHPLRHRSAYPDFCWDGCRDGLSYSGVQVHWASSTVFRARLVVPAAPWIEGSPVRVVALGSGEYPITVQCLVEASGCSEGAGEGSATFGLRAPSRAAGWCPRQASCARLRLSPGAGRPADVVHISGYAPLASIIGPGVPFVFQAVVARGRPRGPEVRFRTRRGVITAGLGHAGLTVLRPPSYASLAAPAPLAEVSAGLSPLGAAPGDPALVAWCAPGSIEVSNGGVQSSVPTAGALTELAAMGFASPAGESAPACSAIVPLGAGSLAVAFPVEPSKGGGPPFYDAALMTHDDGASWTALPVPAKSVSAGFGGFRAAGDELEAVFSRRTQGGTAAFPSLDPAHPLLESTGDGGRTWTPAPLGCPVAGPCVTLGGFTLANCAMTGEPQPLLRSSDGGSSFTLPSLPDQVNACGEAELVATSADTDLLVNSMSPFPLLRSTDGGRRWVDIGLPAIPGETYLAGIGAIGLGPGPGGLTVLPDGGLLLSGSSGDSGRWELLAPRASTWCAVQVPAPAVQRLPQQGPITVIGDQLWWLSGQDGATPAAEEVAAASVAC